MPLPAFINHRIDDFPFRRSFPREIQPIIVLEAMPSGNEIQDVYIFDSLLPVIAADVGEIRRRFNRIPIELITYYADARLEFLVVSASVADQETRPP